MKLYLAHVSRKRHARSAAEINTTQQAQQQSCDDRTKQACENEAQGHEHATNEAKGHVYANENERLAELASRGVLRDLEFLDSRANKKLKSLQIGQTVSFKLEI